MLPWSPAATQYASPMVSTYYDTLFEVIQVQLSASTLFYLVHVELSAKYVKYTVQILEHVDDHHRSSSGTDGRETHDVAEEHGHPIVRLCFDRLACYKVMLLLNML